MPFYYVLVNGSKKLISQGVVFPKSPGAYLCINRLGRVLGGTNEGQSGEIPWQGSSSLGARNNEWLRESHAEYAQAAIAHRGRCTFLLLASSAHTGHSAERFAHLIDPGTP